MRDFDWNDKLWAVVKNDGTFANMPCASYKEARELAAQHEGSKIFFLAYEPDEDEEPENIDDDMGFDPYMGCFTDDC